MGRDGRFCHVVVWAAVGGRGGGRRGGEGGDPRHPPVTGQADRRRPTIEIVVAQASMWAECAACRRLEPLKFVVRFVAYVQPSHPRDASTISEVELATRCTLAPVAAGHRWPCASAPLCGLPPFARMSFAKCY